MTVSLDPREALLQTLLDVGTKLTRLATEYDAGSDYPSLIVITGLATAALQDARARYEEQV